MGSFADQKLARTERGRGGGRCGRGRGKGKEKQRWICRGTRYIYIYIHTRIYPSRVPLVKNDRSFESVVARTADSTPARILRIVSIYNGGGI